MKENDFSVNARRSTRVVLRIPVRLDLQQQDGSTRPWDARTIVLNKHGAKVECSRAFQLGEEVLLSVPQTQTRAKAKVVWTESRSNEDGNFEFAVELDSPQNLWGIQFPPADWKYRAKERRLPSPQPVEPPPAPKTEAPVRVLSCPAEPSSEPIGPALAAEPVAMAGALLSPVLDLTAELSSISNALANERSGESPPVEEAILGSKTSGQMTAAEPEHLPEDPATSSETSSPPEEDFLSPRAEPTPTICPEAPPSWSQSSGGVPKATVGAYAKHRTAMEDFSRAPPEPTLSVLDRKANGFVQPWVAEAESHIRELHTKTLADFQAQIENLAAAQGQLLETQGLEIVARSEQLLEEKIRQCLQTSEQRAHGFLQDLAERTQRNLGSWMQQLVQAIEELLQREVAERVSEALTTLRADTQRELSTLENQFAERLRSPTDRPAARNMQTTPATGRRPRTTAREQEEELRPRGGATARPDSSREKPPPGKPPRGHRQRNRPELPGPTGG